MARPIKDIDDPPPPPPVPIRLDGPIGAHWAALGGEKWGSPYSTPKQTRDKRGQFVDFREPRTNATKTIYWTPESGAHELFGLIREAWNSYRGGASLGYPTSGEMVTHDGVGRFQTFENCMYVWHPDTGAHEVHGDILTKYGELGGSAFGYPITDEEGAKDGRGRYNHFRDLATGADKSIYWTPETGAHELFGYIRSAWLGYTGGASLGYPTTGELVTHDGVGRFQVFENCQYVWHPDTGAFEVHGDILARYGELGGSAFGYPTTDETVTPDGRGRFNHFRDVASGADKSIYWTPETGAHEVYGMIRGRWAELGWETSHIGYPTGPEVDWAPGGPGGREQSFTGGRMLWSGTFGSAAPDPVRFYKRVSPSGIEAFGADVNLELHHDGTVRFHGRVVNTGANEYDYALNAVLVTEHLGLALRRSGSIPRTIPKIGKKIVRSWEETDNRPPVTANYFELQRGSFDVHSKFEGDITGAIDDVLTTLLAWTVTGAFPGTAMLILAGAEIGGIVGGGDFTTGLRIAGGSMWMMGPGGFLMAVAVDGLARLGSTSRSLTAAEHALADLVFKGSLDSATITLTDTAGGGGRAFTFLGMNAGSMNLNLGDDYKDQPDLSVKSYRDLLIHELVHAWQWKNGGNDAGYVVSGIGARFEELFRGQHATYHPDRIGRDWEEYHLEQQATIVEEWFSRWYDPNGSADDDFGLASPGAMNDDRYIYIAKHIRTGDSV